MVVMANSDELFALRPGHIVFYQSECVRPKRRSLCEIARPFTMPHICNTLLVVTALVPVEQEPT